jgi:hypothetical protein
VAALAGRGGAGRPWRRWQAVAALAGRGGAGRPWRRWRPLSICQRRQRARPGSVWHRVATPKMRWMRLRCDRRANWSSRRGIGARQPPGAGTGQASARPAFLVRDQNLAPHGVALPRRAVLF